MLLLRCAPFFNVCLTRHYVFLNYFSLYVVDKMLSPPFYLHFFADSCSSLIPLPKIMIFTFASALFLTQFSFATLLPHLCLLSPLQCSVQIKPSNILLGYETCDSHVGHQSSPSSSSSKAFSHQVGRLHESVHTTLLCYVSYQIDCLPLNPS